MIIVLALAIFSSAGYFTWRLFLKPQEELREEAQLPPPTPPPDPTLPEFAHCLELADSGQTLDARNALTDFIERYPTSTKIDDAKDRLGQINTSLFLSQVQTPDKQVYIVKPGDVITKVALKYKSTPELIMKANNLHGSMLRIGQKLLISSAEFSLVISRKRQKVTVLDNGKFFKQYPIMTAPVRAKAGSGTERRAGPTPKPPKIVGKITDKIAWSAGQRVIFADKGYLDADHWIVIAPSGYSLYTDKPAAPGAPPLQKPSGGGYGLDPSDMQELAAILRKNDPVTIE